MKTKLIFLALLGCNLSFAQQNQSLLGVQPAITPIGSVAAGTTPPSTEIFRFRPGVVTQQDDVLNQNFGFTNSRWFAFGRVPAGGQTFYGSRFQLPNRALVMGYSTTDNFSTVSNPRIQWIGTGAALGNLEFRVANSFTSTVSTLVAQMNADGSTVFGNFDDPSTASTRISVGNNAIGFETGIGIDALAGNANQNSIGVKGSATTLTPFSAGIYGVALQGTNQWGGFFDGRVFGSTFIRPSDARIKENVQPLKNNLELISQSQPVTYNYIPTDKLNLESGLQYGFIAQEIEKIWPDLITEVTKPVFGPDGKVTEMFSFKTVDYMGMIAILAGGIKELNQKVDELENKLAEKELNNLQRVPVPTENSKGASLQQNIPNPFANQTTISYQLPQGTITAAIIVTDLNGSTIKSFPINKNQSEITIKASEIGKGIFIYSLVQNGQILLSKKMIIQ